MMHSLTAKPVVQRGRMQTRAFSPERDADFVFALFCELRAAELSAACSSEAALRSLLGMQHQAQLAWYRRAYPGAERTVFLREQQAVGYWLLDRTREALTLVDFALAAQCRGRGLGGALLRSLQQQAGELPIRLHVRPDNPALRLYQRLGFTITASSATELAMEWLA
jgi:ribosomal protein S18 acetylase RimI-like enzyme